MARVRLDIGSVMVGGGPAPSVIVLKPHDAQPDVGTIQLPIRIGVAEASSISAALARVPVARPLSHDLLVSTIHALRASVAEVVIERVEGTTFYATLSLRGEGGEIVSIDARPSDAIAVALRTGAPLFAEQSVLDTAACPDFAAIAQSEQDEQLASFHSFVENLSPQDFK